MKIFVLKLSLFRTKLLIVLAFLLIVTLGVQYYLNLQNEKQNADLRKKQEQALVAGIVLGVNGMQSPYRMSEILEQENQFFFGEKIRNRIQDVIVISNDWTVYDSLNPDYLPTTDENGKTVYKKLSELKDLPPLVDVERLGEDKSKFPNAVIENENAEAEAHAIPIETNRGRWYVMVILKNERNLIAQRAALSLTYTLAVLLISTTVTVILVWRFTKPIANLSEAARKIAQGDLSVRVPVGNRTDEMGKLAVQFNEMIAQLEKNKKLEQQLKEAEKNAVVGRLASAIAHEIRNPLNYINLTLDHLRAKFAPEDKTRKADFEKLTTQLKAEVARINQQITDFLHYSRPPKLNLKPLEIRKIIEDSIRVAEAEAEDLSVEINFSCANETPEIMGDEQALRSVFNNLFINAIQAMTEKGGTLTISVAPDSEGFVKIEVADTGIGIPPENLPKIFEPYFSTKETGTGLGLAIVERFVNEHKGKITVESELGKGTKFTLRLPKA
ncbi:MAG: sensor histidine kinase [Acidobacteria bacterium]|jgi:signal transduction histidine kinase|nr:MAG: sensor histidine kinase [Acidobacteriota bacterium]GIU81887.1 MAG: two-component sensor histidine kinase [Pyrinomonadaceae bacterium]